MNGILDMINWRTKEATNWPKPTLKLVYSPFPVRTRLPPLVLLKTVNYQQPANLQETELTFGLFSWSLFDWLFGWGFAFSKRGFCWGDIAFTIIFSLVFFL